MYDFNESHNEKMIALEDFIARVGSNIMQATKNDLPFDKISFFKKLLPSNSTFNYSEAEVFKKHPEFMKELISFTSIFTGPEWKKISQLSRTWSDKESQQDPAFAAAMDFIKVYANNPVVKKHKLIVAKNVDLWVKTMEQAADKFPDDPYSPADMMYNYSNTAANPRGGSLAPIDGLDRIIDDIKQMGFDVDHPWDDIKTSTTPESMDIVLSLIHI